MLPRAFNHNPFDNSGYRNNGGYDNNGGYGNNGGFGNNGGYENNGGYGNNGDYGNNGGYENNGDYDNDRSSGEQSGNTWYSEFDGFSRISQHQPVLNTRREITKVLTPEQLQLFDRSQYSELHYNLQNLAKRDPKNINALIGIALCDMAIGEPLKAAEVFAKACDLDESFFPSKFLNDVPTCDPDDWLDMAEELGHYGIIEGSTDVCNSIINSKQFSDRARRQAIKVRDAIQQDYYAARERIIIGNNPGNKKDQFKTGRLTTTFTMVIVPLLLAAVLASWMFYSIQISNGVQCLSRGIYRLERLKKGDTGIERMGKVDHDFEDADDYFNKAIRFNPFTKEAYFYKMQTALLLRDVGRIRSKYENEKWDAARWKEVKNRVNDTQNAYEALELSTDKDLQFKSKWKDFYKESKSNSDKVGF